MTANKRHNREEQRVLLEAYQISGLSSQQFCAQNGISILAFKNWLYRSKISKSSSDTLKFCKLATDSSKEVQPKELQRFIRLRIPNGCILEIPSDLLTHQLQPFLAAMGVLHA